MMLFSKTQKFTPEWLYPSYQDIHDACVSATRTFDVAGFKFDVIAGIQRGGLLPALILSHLLNLPLITIDYSSKEGRGNNKNHSNAIPTFGARKVLLVDDICDSGKTLAELNLNIITYQPLTSVYTFVLFYKDITTPPIVPDFRWRVIPADAGWVVFPFENGNDLPRENVRPTPVTISEGLEVS